MSGELFPSILAECDKHLAKGDVGDWIFPSSNSEGIPDLLPSLQPRGLELPINRWGTVARKTRVDGGVFHFYTDDYRFNALWKDPSPIVNSGCRAIIEPNFSTNGDMPKVIAKSYVYAKRWIARWCQSYGVEVWVDLASVDHGNGRIDITENNATIVTRGGKHYAYGTSRFVDALKHFESLGGGKIYGSEEAISSSLITAFSAG